MQQIIFIHHLLKVLNDADSSSAPGMSNRISDLEAKVNLLMTNPTATMQAPTPAPIMYTVAAPGGVPPGYVIATVPQSTFSYPSTIVPQ